MAATSLGRNYQVFDTGEHVRVDSETGELITPVVREWKPEKHGDCETGELTQTRLVYQRSKFRIPRSALKLPVFETAVHDSNKTNSESMFNPQLLILPLLMFLPGWLIILYIMAETLYHIRTHRKDTPVCNTPLQIVFQHSCAECVHKRQMKRIGKLQDERMLRLTSRRILNCNYAQFGISS